MVLVLFKKQLYIYTLYKWMSIGFYHLEIANFQCEAYKKHAIYKSVSALIFQGTYNNLFLTRTFMNTGFLFFWN